MEKMSEKSYKYILLQNVTKYNERGSTIGHLSIFYLQKKGRGTAIPIRPLHTALTKHY